MDLNVKTRSEFFALIASLRDRFIFLNISDIGIFLYTILLYLLDEFKSFSYVPPKFFLYE